MNKGKTISREKQVRDTLDKQAQYCPCFICPRYEGCNTICKEFRTYTLAAYNSNQKRAFDKLKVKWVVKPNQSGGLE